MTEFHVIIPARYQSTRLPAKSLALIGDKSMIVHVCDRAKESGALSVTVATDDTRILDEVSSHGFNAVMTSAAHQSGSDRVFEAAELLKLSDEDIVVNVQGDEPFIPSENISLVASLVNADKNPVATLCCPAESTAEVLDANAVKVVFDNQNNAIYFSRAPIPFNRDCPVKRESTLADNYFRHIGIYAFRKAFLGQFIQWPLGRLEASESLEQLRIIENGYQIKLACLAEVPPHGIDTPADLQKAREIYSTR